MLHMLHSSELNSRYSTYGRSVISWDAGNGFDEVAKLLIKGIGDHLRGFKRLFGGVYYEIEDCRSWLTQTSTIPNGIGNLRHSLKWKHDQKWTILVEKKEKERAIAVTQAPCRFSPIRLYPHSFECLRIPNKSLPILNTLSMRMYVVAVKEYHGFLNPFWRWFIEIIVLQFSCLIK